MEIREYIDANGREMRHEVVDVAREMEDFQAMLAMNKAQAQQAAAGDPKAKERNDIMDLLTEKFKGLSEEPARSEDDDESRFIRELEAANQAPPVPSQQQQQQQQQQQGIQGQKGTGSKGAPLDFLDNLIAAEEREEQEIADKATQLIRERGSKRAAAQTRQTTTESAARMNSMSSPERSGGVQGTAASRNAEGVVKSTGPSTGKSAGGSGWKKGFLSSSNKSKSANTSSSKQATALPASTTAGTAAGSTLHNSALETTETNMSLNTNPSTSSANTAGGGAAAPTVRFADSAKKEEEQKPKPKAPVAFTGNIIERF